MAQTCVHALFTDRCILQLNSVGHLIIDSLASRLGVRMSSDRAMGGIIGHTTTTVGDPGTLVHVTLFKPSKHVLSILPDHAEDARF